MAAGIASRVDFVAEMLSLTQDDVSRLVRVSPRAVSRWRSGESMPHRPARERLLELAYIGRQLAKVLRPDDANLWLFSRNELLDNDSPAERIRAGDFKSVIALIEALADGVVA